MVGKSHRGILFILQHFGGKSCQHLLWAYFDKQPCSLFIQQFQTLYPLHGRCHLACQPVQVLFHVSRISTVRTCIHVGYQGNPWGLKSEFPQDLPQGLNRRSNHEGMESVGDCQFHRFNAHGLQLFHHHEHGLRQSSDDSLAPGVVIGHDHAIDAIDTLYQFVGRCKNSSHLTNVVHLYP